ncbi:SDR family oxidoreductase [Amycolatopsis jejuensis]|uniref:SDR family oxidoreductase n=1 Tax=Amycolatopsis jejuensis TaxID=330084 RepID=UPI000527A433|nr:SDR family oxidoreductase [Amycolatopsis jejuensis]
MQIFVTGASGWIGSAVVEELVANGHSVLGLARSAESAAKVKALGAEVLPGDLDDLAALRSGAGQAEAVIHLANKHDWGNPAESDRAERAAVQAMLDVLAGTGRAFMVANGLSGLVEGRPALETDASPAIGPDADRGGSENLVLGYAEKGVHSLAIRFAPSVHGAGDWGFVNFLTQAARERGVSGYLGDGSAQWSAVHRRDAARLVRLGIEKAPAGARLHAVAEQAVSTRDIANAIADSLDLPVTSIAPENATEHFGFVGSFFADTMTGSNDRTRALLSWKPLGPGLLEDIRMGAYRS